MEIIPAIDLYDNQVVRLYKGKYNQIKVYSKNPEDLIQYFQDIGIRRVHIVDLNAARNGDITVNRKSREKILKKANHLNLEIGGGIRSYDVVQEYLSMGFRYLILGTVAIKNPEFVEDIIMSFPKDHFIIGVDVENLYVRVSGWEEHTYVGLFELVRKIEDWGIEQIIVTDISKDGTLKGPNIQLLETLSRQCSLKIIASGGISSSEDVRKLKEISRKLTGVIIGKAFYEKKIDLSSLILEFH